MARKPTLKQSCADPEYVAALAERNIAQADEIPASKTFKKGEKIRLWKLIDAKGHDNPYWTARCGNISRGHGCPFAGIKKFAKLLCSPTCKICSKFSLASRESSLQKRNIKYASRNENPASAVFSQCSDPFWWECTISKHQWQATANSITGYSQSGCPQPCCSPHPKLCDAEQCTLCLPRSIEGQEKDLRLRSIRYSTKNVKSAREVTYGSSDPFWWECIISKHQWQAAASSIIGKRSGCPQPCCSIHPKLCDVEQCTICLPRSIAGQEKDLRLRSIRYSTKNVKSAREVISQCNDPIWWECLRSEHKWQAPPCNIIGKRTGCPQPCCCPNPKLCNAEECTVCLPRSIAGQEKDLRLRFIRYSTKNVKSAREVISQCNDPFWWECLRSEHQWQTAASNIMGKKRTNCPRCYGKTEALVEQKLQEFLPNLIVTRDRKQLCYGWCTNSVTNRSLPQDIAILDADHKLLAIVEVDGRHHFQSGNIFGGSHDNCHNAQRKKDTQKAWSAFLQGIPIIRIVQEECLEGPLQWPGWLEALKSAVANALQTVSSQQVSRDSEVYVLHKVDLEAAIAAGSATYTDDDDTDDDSEDNNTAIDEEPASMNLTLAGTKRPREDMSEI